MDIDFPWNILIKRSFIKKSTLIIKISTSYNCFKFCSFSRFACIQVFQCLLIEGENCGSDALRHAETFVISDDKFSRFVERHSMLSCLVPESNEKVRNKPFLIHSLTA